MRMRRISKSGFRVVGLALLVASIAEPAASRDASAHGPLDLRLRPGDIAPAGGRAELLPPLGLPTEADRRREYAEEVGAVDQVARQDIPNQPRLANGEQEVVGSDILKDLLENKTIPLFRVTLQPSL